MTGLALAIALGAALAAVAAFASARRARADLAARAADVARLEKASEEATALASDARAEAKARREEVVALRGELQAARKKAFDQLEAAKRSGGAQALREEVDKLSTRLAEARAEAQVSGERARALEAQLERQGKEAERLRAAAERKAAEPAPAAPAPAVPPAPDPGVEQVAAERERADKAEAKVAELRKKAADLERELKGARGRLETEKRVYVVQKGELELAQDRYAELHRRHEALRKEHDELIEAVREAAKEEAHAGTPAPGGGESAG
ncbi:MAG TPA: hypothetical protein VH880_15705 [Anaeromyxobacteraceae bacterium]|jgi:DNA repair exonuclease SbcCD ATPase subunit